MQARGEQGDESLDMKFRSMFCSKTTKKIKSSYFSPTISIGEECPRCFEPNLANSGGGGGVLFLPLASISFPRHW